LRLSGSSKLIERSFPIQVFTGLLLNVIGRFWRFLLILLLKGKLKIRRPLEIIFDTLFDSFKVLTDGNV